LDHLHLSDQLDQEGLEDLAVRQLGLEHLGDQQGLRHYQVDQVDLAGLLGRSNCMAGYISLPNRTLFRPKSFCRR
jgi:hypothetical protein